MADNPLMCSGEIGFVRSETLACFEPANGFLCSLPAETSEEAADFLETLASGTALGTGVQMSRLGVRMPVIREAYEREIQRLIVEVQQRRRAGQSARVIARFAVEERRRIANRMRWKSGPGTRILFEIRDWAEYGPGGRSYRNVETRYLRKGYTGNNLYPRMIQGATSPNTGISNTAIRGARYLRHGGRAIVVISLASTAYTILTAPEDRLERVIAQEAGGFIGGAAGTSVAVGACLVFGIATGGWGLLACGIVGGIGGGISGTWVANRLYTSANRDLDEQVRETGILNFSDLLAEPPAPMCVAPISR